MKQLVLILICSLALMDVLAQHDRHETSLSLTFGGSIPVGPFSSTKLLDNSAGYAKPGEAVNLSLTHHLTRELAVMATLYGQRNAINTSLLARQYASLAIPFYYNGNGPNYYPNYSFDKKNWELASFLLGIDASLVNLPESKWSLRAKALIGFAYVQLPKVNGNSKTDTPYLIIKQQSATAFGAAFNFGIGAEYRCSNKWALLFNVEYFGTSTITFKNVGEFIAATNGGLNVPGFYDLSNSRLPIQALEAVSNNKQSIGTLNLQIGIGLKL